MPVLSDADVGLSGLSDSDVGLKPLSDYEVGIGGFPTHDEDVSPEENRARLDAALDLFRQTHPDAFPIQGPGLEQPTSLAPATTPQPAPEPIQQPGAISELPARPAGIGYFLSEPPAARTHLEPIEPRRGIDFPSREQPDIGSPLEALQKPTKMPFPRVTAEQVAQMPIGPPGVTLPRWAAGPIAGTEQAIADVADFMTSGAGVLTAMTGGVAALPEAGEHVIASQIPKATARIFAATMAESMPDQFEEVARAIDRGDTATATRGLLNGALSLGVIGHAAQGAVTPTARAVPETVPAVPEAPPTPITPAEPPLQPDRLQSLADELKNELTKRQIVPQRETPAATPGELIQKAVEEQPLAPSPPPEPTLNAPESVQGGIRPQTVEQSLPQPEQRTGAMPIEEPPQVKPTSKLPDFGNYTVLDAVKDHGGLGGPNLEDAMRQMEGGKTAAQVLAPYGSDYDTLADALEAIFEARQKGKGRAEARKLARAYQAAGFGGDRGGADQTYQALADAQEQGHGFPGGLPRDAGDLVTRAWETASGRAAPTPEEKAATFWKAVDDPNSKIGLQKINVQDLNVGDTFRIRGKGISHEELTVAHLDPDTGEVQVKDGPKLGAQTLPDGAEIWVQKGTHTDAEGKLREEPTKPTAPAEQPLPTKPDVAPQNKVESAASRFRPREQVRFEKPLVGPSGEKLVAYEWKWQPEEYIDKRGEERVRRVSNWDEAEASAETGRGLVHQFVVESPDGKQRLVSAETVPQVLGYSEKASPKVLGSIVSASKTLAKQRMKLATVKARIADYERIVEEVNGLPVPTDKITSEPAIAQVGKDAGQRWATNWKMDDAHVIQREEGPIQPERKDTLIDAWKRNRINERGGKPVYESVRDLERRIAKQEAKLETLTQHQPEATQSAREEPPLFGAPESVEDQKARLALEAKRKQEQAQREEITRRQAKPLIGKQGDIGQKDMFGGGDLFSENYSDKERIDELSNRLYGRGYDELTSAQQEAAKTILDDVQRRQSTTPTPGREPAAGREPIQAGRVPERPPGEIQRPATAPASGELSRIQWLESELAKERELEKSSPKGDAFVRRRSIEGQLEALKHPETVTDLDALKVEARQEEAQLARLSKLRDNFPASKLGVETLGRLRFLEGQMEELERRQREQATPIESRGARGGNLSTLGFLDPANYRDLLPEDAKDHMRLAAKWATDKWTKLSNRVARSKPYDYVSKVKDAADNISNILGKQTGNAVLHALNRAFDVAPGKVKGERNALRENALTFAVEADGERSELGRMKYALMNADAESIHAIWKRRALAAIEFAEQNWDRLQPVADLYKRVTTAQRDYEASKGLRSTRVSGGYVMHVQDVDTSFGNLRAGSTGQGGGAPQPFNHIRDHATYADAIANGIVPESLNGIDLLQRRVALGQRLVRYGEWVDGLRDLTDPKTSTPVVTDPIERQRADGSSDITAPAGYGLYDFGGKQVALHNGYAGLMGDLTNPSWMQGSEFRKAVMNTMGLAKHTALLFDTYHMGRLAFWNAVTRLGAPRYERGMTLLDNTTGEIRRMIDNSEVPQEWGQDLLESKRKLQLMTQEGLNVGNIGDNLYTDFLSKLPALGTFNKWLFDKYQRGAMSEVGLIEFDRQKKMFPDETDAQIARRVAKDVNTRFGNLQSQSWIKSRTGQDLARVIFLAPQWNESLIRAELGALKQFGSSAVSAVQGRAQMGALGRGISTAMLGIFIGNQLLNYATRGKPTWENPEEGFGAKISAWIPDVIGGGPGFFLNPMSVPAEITHLLMKSTERHGGDFGLAVNDYLAGRMSNLTKAIYTEIYGKTPMGQQTTSGLDRLKTAAGQLVPTPISAGAVARGAKQLVTGEHSEKFPGEFQKQIMQSTGVKTEQAPAAERRITQLAKNFEREKGITEKPGVDLPVYGELTAAIRRGNVTDANDAVDKLLQTAKDNGEKRTLGDISKYYQEWTRRPFSYSQKLERQFYDSLSPEQKEAYTRARTDRGDVAKKVGELLTERGRQLVQ